MKNLFLALIIGTISLSIPALADQRIDLKKLENKVSVDLRKDKSVNNLYMIIFFARKANTEKESKVGHAYIATLQFDESTNSFLETGVFGMYPSGTVWHLGKFPGRIDLTELDAEPNAAILAWINKPEYDKVLQIRSKWDKEATWQALQGDCVTMVSEAVKAVGLKLPQRTSGVLPYDYLKEVVSMNALK